MWLKTQKKSNMTKLRMWPNSKTQNLTTQKKQNVTKHKKKLKVWQNTKTKNGTKCTNLKCDKTQNSECDIPRQLKMWRN